MAIIATCLGHEAGGFMGNQEGTTAGQVILGTKQQALSTVKPAKAHCRIHIELNVLEMLARPFTYTFSALLLHK